VCPVKGGLEGVGGVTHIRNGYVKGRGDRGGPRAESFVNHTKGEHILWCCVWSGGSRGGGGRQRDLIF
jgi:hypothetical protein